MDFRKRIITAFALLALFTIIAFGIQVYIEGETMAVTGEAAPLPLAQ